MAELQHSLTIPTVKNEVVMVGLDPPPVGEVSHTDVPLKGLLVNELDNLLSGRELHAHCKIERKGEVDRLWAERESLHE